MKIKITKVWIIDSQLVVADSIAEAVQIVKQFAGRGESYEPHSVTQVSSRLGYGTIEDVDFIAITKDKDDD